MVKAESETITPYPKIIIIHPIKSGNPNLLVYLILSQNENHADKKKFSP